MDPEDFKIVGTIDTVSGNTITSASFGSQASGWLNGGYITWVTDAGLTERRGIKTHTGTSIVIAGFTFGLVAGDNISAFAGCRRTRTVCNTKFNNILNYGGTMMYSPGRNPFDGNPVF
jgi:uncharacterized phage protein (TIGR02218 family)